MQMRVPVLAVEDLREAIATVFDLVVRAEQADAHVVLLRLRAAVGPHVTEHEIAESISSRSSVEIVAAARSRRGTARRASPPARDRDRARAGRRGSRARCARPRDTSASTRRADRPRPRTPVELELAVAGLRRLSLLDDEPLLVLGVEHLLAVRRDLERRRARRVAVDLLEECLGSCASSGRSVRRRAAGGLRRGARGSPRRRSAMGAEPRRTGHRPAADLELDVVRAIDRAARRCAGRCRRSRPSPSIRRFRRPCRFSLSALSPLSPFAFPPGAPRRSFFVALGCDRRRLSLCSTTP